MALISLLLTLAQGEQVKGMLFWLMGDLSHPQGLLFAWFVLLAVGLCATVLSGGLDVLAGGLDKAAALGVAVGRWQAGLYFAAAVLTVTALQLGGSIGFVGLMIPHAIRLLGVSAHRWLIPSSILLGGSFLVLADTLARMVWLPLQLPVGIFLRTLAGLHTPQSGMVSWNGVALAAHARRNLAQHLGVLLQNEGGEFWGSVQEYAIARPLSLSHLVVRL